MDLAVELQKIYDSEIISRLPGFGTAASMSGSATR
jgi:hypothetical protein